MEASLSVTDMVTAAAVTTEQQQQPGGEGGSSSSSRSGLSPEEIHKMMMESPVIKVKKFGLTIIHLMCCTVAF